MFNGIGLAGAGLASTFSPAFGAGLISLVCGGDSLALVALVIGLLSLVCELIIPPFACVVGLISLISGLGLGLTSLVYSIGFPVLV